MRRFIAIFSIVFVLAAVAYGYFMYYYQFSTGSRSGQLIKFSRKGMVFKTHEGVIVQSGFARGAGATVRSKDFHFSVCDPAIADSLTRCSDKKVELHYVQYRKSLPWRGDNYNGINEENGQYIIDQILRVESLYPNMQPQAYPNQQQQNIQRSQQQNQQQPQQQAQPQQQQQIQEPAQPMQ